jgi:hypothetical protein
MFSESRKKKKDTKYSRLDQGQFFVFNKIFSKIGEVGPEHKCCGAGAARNCIIFGEAGCKTVRFRLRLQFRLGSDGSDYEFDAQHTIF